MTRPMKIAQRRFLHRLNPLPIVLICDRMVPVRIIPLGADERWEFAPSAPGEWGCCRLARQEQVLPGHVRDTINRPGGLRLDPRGDSSLHTRRRTETAIGRPSMQIHRFLAFVVGIAAFAAIGPSFAQTVQGFVQEVSGNVTAQVGTRSPRSVSRGQTLVSNAIIATGPGSYVALKFEDGTAVLLKENTSFQIQSYAYNPKAPEHASAIFNLVRGGQ